MALVLTGHLLRQLCRAGSRQGLPVVLAGGRERVVKAQHRAPQLQGGPAVIGHHERFTAGLHLAEQLQGLGLEAGFRDLPRRTRRQLLGLSADRINICDPLAMPVATGPVTDEGGRRLLG